MLIFHSHLKRFRDAWANTPCRWLPLFVWKKELVVEMSSHSFVKQCFEECSLHTISFIRVIVLWNLSRDLKCQAAVWKKIKHLLSSSWKNHETFTKCLQNHRKQSNKNQFLISIQLLCKISFCFFLPIILSRRLQCVAWFSSARRRSAY